MAKQKNTKAKRKKTVKFRTSLDRKPWNTCSDSEDTLIQKKPRR